MKKGTIFSILLVVLISLGFNKLADNIGYKQFKVNSIENPKPTSNHDEDGPGPQKIGTREIRF